MLASGYLKIVGDISCPAETAEDDIDCRVAISNLETAIAIRSIIRQWFQTGGGDYNQFIRYLLKNDLEGMNGYMSTLLLTTFSSFNVPGRTEDARQPERFFHGFVLGLMVELRQEYEIRSNRESGYGRYDVALIPRDQKDETKCAYLMEFKLFSPRTEKALADTVANALRQIEEKKYEADLRDRGFPAERIHKYGFGFRGKDVLIGE